MYLEPVPKEVSEHGDGTGGSPGRQDAAAGKKEDKEEDRAGGKEVALPCNDAPSVAAPQEGGNR